MLLLSGAFCVLAERACSMGADNACICTVACAPTSVASSLLHVTKYDLQGLFTQTHVPFQLAGLHPKALALSSKCSITDLHDNMSAREAVGDTSTVHRYDRGATSRCASARCVLRGFVSEIELIDKTTCKANCGG
eukprot:3559284-Pleurochrysis_carterae.AAC.4